MADDENKKINFKVKAFKPTCSRCRRFNPKALIIYICTIAGQCPAVDFSEEEKQALLQRQEII